MTRLRPSPSIDLTPASAAPATADAHFERTVDLRLSTHVRASQGRQPAQVTRLRHLELQQIAALEVSGQPMDVRNAFGQPQAVFVFSLLQGDCSLACEAGTTRLQAGQFVALRGDRSVHVRHAAPFLVRGTRIVAAQLERELPNWADAECRPRDGRSGAGALLLALQDCLLSHGQALGDRSGDAFGQHLACVLADALRAGLADTASDPRSQAEHHRRRIRAHVRRNLGDPTLDTAAVAAAVGLSVAHLHRLFAGEPLSLSAWIQSERLDGCREALGRPTRSLAELARRWGFRDPAHFSRSFKRRFGVSPSAFRAGETKLAR